MRKLIIYLKEYRKECVLAPLFKMLEAGFELFVPLVVARIIDEGISKGNHEGILTNGGLLLLLAVIGVVCAISAQFFAAKAAVGFGSNLREALFSNLLKLSYADMDRINSSTMITRMTSDINQAQTGVNMVLRLFLRSPFIVFGAMIMAFTVDVKAAWIFVVAIPLLSIVVFGVILSGIPLYKRVQKALDRILLRTRENMEGVRVIRAFRGEKEQQSLFEEENEQLTKFQLFAGRISTMMNPVTYFIINVAAIVLVWIGGKEVYVGTITQGEVVALVNYMSQILVELIKLANLIITINKSLASADRIEEMLEVQPTMQEGSTLEAAMPSEYHVEFKDASIAYAKSNETSLSHVNLKVKRGEVIGIIGGTGSGKTTLVNLIPRYYDVTEGAVFVNGVDVRDYTFATLRNQIGVVMQKAVLFHGTIRENLLWGNENATDEEIMQAVNIAQATDVVKDKGLDAMIEEGGKNLSGGQRQRLTIARALVRKPDILILDDSSSALDFATDAALRKALRESSQDRTVFIVSQRTSSIHHADQIVVLDDGEVAGIGTHDSLLKNCPVYEEIHMSQYKKEGKS